MREERDRCLREEKRARCEQRRGKKGVRERWGEAWRGAVEAGYDGV